MSSHDHPAFHCADTDALSSPESESVDYAQPSFDDWQGILNSSSHPSTLQNREPESPCLDSAACSSAGYPESHCGDSATLSSHEHPAFHCADTDALSSSDYLVSDDDYLSSMYSSHLGSVIGSESDSSEEDYDVVLHEGSEGFIVSTQPITQREIQQLIHSFETNTKNKTDQYRSKGRGRIFLTIDNLLDDFSECQNIDHRNQIVDHIVLLCDSWMKKHSVTIDYHKSYQNIYNYLNLFKQGIGSLKDRSFDNNVENDTLSGADRNKRLKKAQTLIERYSKYSYMGRPSQFFTGVVPNILDLMSPDTGDKSKFDATLRFPISGGFIGSQVTLSAERKEDSEFKVNFEGSFQGGGSVGIAALGSKLGVYFECNAQDSKSVGKLLDYGLYRRFRESHIIPRGITSQLWGGGFGKEGYQKSEVRASQIEEDVFGDKKEDGTYTDIAKKSHIETGGAVGFLGDFGMGGVGTGKIGAQYFKGTRYNQFTLDQTRGEREGHEDQNAQGSGVGKNEFLDNTGKLGPQKTKGQSIERILMTHSGSLAGFGKYSAKLKLDLAQRPGSRSLDERFINKWEIDLDGGAYVPAHEYARNDGLFRLSMAVSAVEGLRSVWAKTQDKYKTKAQFAGAALNPMRDLSAQLTTAFTAKPKLSENEANSFEGLVGLNLNAKCGQEAKADKQFVDGKSNLGPFKFELGFQKISTTGVTLNDSSITLVTAKRLAQFKMEHQNKMKAEFYPLACEKKYEPVPESEQGGEENANRQSHRWGKFKQK